MLVSQSKSEEPTLPCPYNNSHRLVESRLLTHILKCPDKEKKGHLFKVCPYNELHYYPKDCYDEKVKNCPDGRKVQKRKEEDIDEDAFQAALKKQFSVKPKEAEKKANEKNKNVPGYNEASKPENKEEEQEKPKKRIRNRTKKNAEGEENSEALKTSAESKSKKDQEMEEFYEKAYGAQAKLLQQKDEEKNKEEDFDWENAFESEDQSKSEVFDADSTQSIQHVSNSILADLQPEANLMQQVLVSNPDKSIEPTNPKKKKNKKKKGNQNESQGNSSLDVSEATWDEEKKEDANGSSSKLEVSKIDDWGNESLISKSDVSKIDNWGEASIVSAKSSGKKSSKNDKKLDDSIYSSQKKILDDLSMCDDMSESTDVSSTSDIKAVNILEAQTVNLGDMVTKQAPSDDDGWVTNNAKPKTNKSRKGKKY